MIVDLGKDYLPKAVQRGVCVVGTGMGGGSFITRYMNGKQDIVAIEAGSEQENSAVRAESVGRDFGLPVTRDVSLGGTSNIWRGLCSPLDPIDYISRPWIPNSGWPVGPDVLVPYYIEAGRMLGLPHFSYLLPRQAEERLGNLPYDFEFNRSMLSNKYFLHARSPKSFRADLQQQFSRGQQMLIMNGVAVEIVTHSEGRVVEKILVKDPRGDCIEVHARQFVLAAGALETPRLLLNSRKWNENGVGNHSQRVGRFLMDHPMGSLSQLSLGSIRKAPLYHSINLDQNHHIKSGLIPSEGVQRRHRLPNHCVYLWPSFRKGIDDRFEHLRRVLITARKRQLKAGDFVTLLSNPNTIYRILSYILPVNSYYRYADLFFVTEQIPNPNSYVSLSSEKDRFGYFVARIHWEVTKGDLDSISVFNDLTLKALSLGTTRVSFRKGRENVGATLTSAAHHMGTARMSSYRQNGVVNENLNVWGVDNLYICDASVFPTSGNANPSLTICALAIRLADLMLKLPS
jgi:choline dehydrogenase-like flavoprotein